MAAFPRDQDLSEDSSLPIITGHELVSTFPDYFHPTRSQYDIIGLPGFEGVELVPPESTTNCNNIISILADYDGLTPLLERAFQPNVHGGCFPDLLRSEEQESCNGHQSAALILSDSRKPAIVGSEDQWQQVPDPQQRQIRDVGGTNPKQPSPERDPSMPPAPEDCKKRKSDHILSFAAVEDPKKSPPTLQEDRTRARRPSGCGGSKCHNKESPGNAESRSRNAKAKANAEPPTDYIHVRARRGQATDSHSLAERARREKISERMRKLQDLVPGCDKVTGKAVMLDEIINYIQSLQNQVEFLSMKLASLNPRFSHLGLLDGFLEELLPLQGSGSSADPSEVYEAAANLAEGHHQAPMQDQMPCALDMAFSTTISAYNSLTDRPRRPSIDGRAVGISQCGCNTIR